VCVCVCAYVLLGVCVFVCLCVCVFVSVCAYVLLGVCVCTYVLLGVCVRMCYLCVCLCVCLRVCVPVGIFGYSSVVKSPKIEKIESNCSFEGTRQYMTLNMTLHSVAY